MNHYEWLEENFPNFLSKLGLEEQIKYSNAIITADGDKCYGYKFVWENNGIPFVHGCAIYLISKIYPYSEEVRETKNGFVAPSVWVINNYERFKGCLEKI
jgi:hypothetical protein